MEHVSRQCLAAGLGRICDSPRDGGRVVLVVCRPAVGVRELPGEALLDPVTGLAGDNWLTRGSKGMPGGSADPRRQVTVMNARVAELVAGGTDRMALAGDQLYIDLDLSVGNLPAGSLLAVGQAVLQVSDAPASGLCEIRRPVRRRGNAFRQLRSRAAAAAARDERPCGATGSRPPRRHCHPAAGDRAPALTVAREYTASVP
jgi:hypothetical protein